MSDGRLLRMLEDIAAFYRAYPHDEAVDGVAGHVRTFWDPRMRATVAALLREDAKALSPLARAGFEAAMQRGPQVAPPAGTASA